MASSGVAEVLLQQPLTGWQRPQHLQVPRVWLREQGLVVRDVTPDLYPFVVQHMKDNFMRDEPMNQATGAADDPVTVIEYLTLWEKIILSQGLSLVALQEGTPGADLEQVSEENAPVIIGVNQLLVSTKADPPLPDFGKLLQSDILKLTLKKFLLCGGLVNIFEKYGVDLYMDGAGLSVVPSWRGKGVGQMIVRARDALCREMGIPVIKTVFTAIQSQKVALKTGYELLGQLVYADMKAPDGQPLFPNMHPDQKTIQLMAKRIT